MKYKTHPSPFRNLKKYLPEGTFSVMAYYLKRYRVELTIKVSRKSVLGDYRKPYRGKGHRISINRDLNQYAFFLTLVHELAHLLAFETYGSRIKPHGREWKHTFQQLMEEMNRTAVFPVDVSRAIQKYMKNPAARSCSDPDMVRTLRKYDPPKGDNICMVEELIDGEKFMVYSGEVFVRGQKLRKRYKCKSEKTGLLYVFSPLYEVKKILRE